MLPSETRHARPDRRARLLAPLDVGDGRGLEIGPLYSPIVLKSEADVVYVDITDTESLRAHYATHPGTPVEDIVEVDHPLTVDGEVRTIAEVTEGVAPFRWAIASHVIEHVPDLVGWLRDVGAVLEDGGLLSLAIPDRRYSFDARRPATTVGQVLEAHLHGDRRPSVRAVFDHHHDAIDLEPAALWAAEEPPGEHARIFDLAMAHGMYRRALDGEYVDSHCWLFTPAELVAQLEVLIHFGLLDFTVAAIEPTRVDDVEFFLTLRRLDRGLDLEGVRRAVEVGFPRPPEDGRTASPTAVRMELSEAEVRAVEAKRRAMTRLRGLRDRAVDAARARRS